MSEKFKVRVVNPGKKKDSMARNKKGQFKKGGHRRKRRSNPAPAPAAPRRRRRRNPSGSRRRRRRNPMGPQTFGVGSYPLKNLIPVILASLAQSYVVRKWGDAWGTGIMSPTPLPGSGYRGQSWSLKNYILAGLTGWLGAKLMGRTKMGAGWAQIWWRTSVESMATRLVWTEMIARSQWGQTNFGAVQASPGDVRDDANGNRWLMGANGQWVSMQGYGELVQAGPLGELVQAGPLGRYAGGYRPAPYAGFGHLMAEDTSDARNTQAQELGIGSRDPYLAALQNAA